MKSLHHFRTVHGIEVLENRIAPAAVVFNFTDQDGDAVKVTSSKGTAAQLAAAFTLSGGATGNPTMIDLTAIVGTASVFARADLSIVATPAGGGDGFVRVELINATGVDLGQVTIDGELDSINAGDGNSGTPGLRSITVEKWGNGEAFDSVVVGAITTLTVKGDFNGAYLKVRGSDSDEPDPPPPLPPAPHVTDPQGKIGTLFIGGSLVGTARDPKPGETTGRDGGHIFTTGDIKKATVIGSVAGYRAANTTLLPAAPQEFSGRIFSLGVIGSLVIGTDAVPGNLAGGDGSSSGQIVGVSGIGSITVKGSVQGGDGKDSGSIGAVGQIGKVVITGDLAGGDGGPRSGTILGFTTINNVTIGGDIVGGMGENSGAIGAGNNFRLPDRVQIGNVLVGGDIVGGDGLSSGQIVSQGVIKNITVGGSLIGGSEFETGAIGSLKGLGSILIKGDIQAGTGARSGFIATEKELFEERNDPGEANAPIANVTVLGSIIGDLGDDLEDGDSNPGYRAGGILSSGQLGPVVVVGDLVGGDYFEAGRIASSRGITSVKIGGAVLGGGGDDSGTIFAGTTLGPVAIGDPDFPGEMRNGFSGGGILGGGGTRSGSVIAGQIKMIDVFGNLEGGSELESGVIKTIGRGAAGKLGAVEVRGSVLGSSGEDSGVISSDADIASVFIGGEVCGGAGDGSGSLQSSDNLGPVTIGGGGLFSGSLIGGGGDRSGAVISGGKLARIDVFGSVLGGDGPDSGSIETQGEGALGDMGPVFIANSLIGSFGSTGATNSGQIFSSGKLASVVIGDPKNSDTESGSVIGGIARESGTIASELDLGPVKIKADLRGGTGDESGKITSGGKLASLSVGSETIRGSIIGGTGNYHTTAGSGDQLGQVFAEGTIGAVVVFGNVQGNPGGGAYSAQIRGLSIASVTIHGDLEGGLGAHSGGLFATSLNIGPIDIAGSVRGGGGFSSGFISAEGNLPSVKIGVALDGGSGPGSGYVAAGGNLGSFEADFASGDSDSSRARISAGRMISSVTINEAIADTDILAGYDTSGSAFNPDAQIGTVKIGTGTGPGSMYGTNIVAGLSAGSNGRFGDSDDRPIAGTDNPAIYSRIASVIVKGSITDTDSDHRFGIVAQHLVSLKIGPSTLPLTSGPLNDDYTAIPGASDTVYGERILD